MRVRRILAAIIFIASVSLIFGRAQASQVVSVSLPGLLKADLVFRGTCTGAETYMMYHPKVPRGLLVTTYTFSVAGDGVIKGDISETISFTQWGAPLVESRQFKSPFIVGMPHYEVGKEYTVFLTSESVLGLRSTIGLGVGKFNVITDPGGKKMVVNDYGNRGLFRGIMKRPSVTKALSAAGVRPDQPVKGPVGYDDFISVVRDLDARK